MYSKQTIIFSQGNFAMKSSYHVPPDGDLKENTADEVLNFS